MPTYTAKSPYHLRLQFVDTAASTARNPHVFDGMPQDAPVETGTNKYALSWYDAYPFTKPLVHKVVAYFLPSRVEPDLAILSFSASVCVSQALFVMSD